MHVSFSSISYFLSYHAKTTHTHTHTHTRAHTHTHTTPHHTTHTHIHTHHTTPHHTTHTHTYTHTHTHTHTYTLTQTRINATIIKINSHLSAIVSVVYMYRYFTLSYAVSITVYEHENYSGRRWTYTCDTPDLFDANNVVSSLRIRGES